MVKLYCLAILYKDSTKATILQTAFNLQSFSFFQKGSVQEFMTFFSKTIVERTQPACRQSIKKDEYMSHVYVRHDSLAAVVISDDDYPTRVSHTLLTNILDEFSKNIPHTSWPQLTENDVHFTQLNNYLLRYQNPREADTLTKIQDDLDETKIILHNTIEAVLERGEKIDDLVAKSEGLSIQSKAFYKTARKTNSCCNFG